jgi:hypothetical protein
MARIVISSELIDPNNQVVIGGGYFGLRPFLDLLAQKYLFKP